MNSLLSANLYITFSCISLLNIVNLNYTGAQMTGQTSVPFDMCLIRFGTLPLFNPFTTVRDFATVRGEVP